MRITITSNDGEYYDAFVVTRLHTVAGETLVYGKSENSGEGEQVLFRDCAGPLCDDLMAELRCCQRKEEREEAARDADADARQDEQRLGDDGHCHCRAPDCPHNQPGGRSEHGSR